MSFVGLDQVNQLTFLTATIRKRINSNRYLRLSQQISFKIEVLYNITKFVNGLIFQKS